MYNFRFVSYLTTGCDKISHDRTLINNLTTFKDSILKDWKKSSRKQQYRDKNQSDFDKLIGKTHSPTTEEVRAILKDKLIIEQVSRL